MWAGASVTPAFVGARAARSLCPCLEDSWCPRPAGCGVLSMGKEVTGGGASAQPGSHTHTPLSTSSRHLLMCAVSQGGR